MSRRARARARSAHSQQRDEAAQVLDTSKQVTTGSPVAASSASAIRCRSCGVGEVGAHHRRLGSPSVSRGARDRLLVEVDEHGVRRARDRRAPPRPRGRCRSRGRPTGRPPRINGAASAVAQLVLGPDRRRRLVGDSLLPVGHAQVDFARGAAIVAVPMSSAVARSAASGPLRHSAQPLRVAFVGPQVWLDGCAPGRPAHGLRRAASRSGPGIDLERELAAAALRPGRDGRLRSARRAERVAPRRCPASRSVCSSAARPPSDTADVLDALDGRLASCPR